MGRIAGIKARQILDSKGNPTLEVDLVTEQGVLGRASVSSTRSGAKYSAVKIRDNDDGRFLGRGVLKTINSVNKILNEELQGLYVFDQNIIDAALIQLDGTQNKSNLGANTTLAVSLAAAKAAANAVGQSLYRYIGGINGNTLPLPMINVLNGGEDVSNNLSFQEFMIMPFANSFSESMQIGVEVFQYLKQILHEKKLLINVSDEGGFAPKLKNTKQALNLIIQAIEKAGYKAGDDVSIALNIAANRFYNEKEKNYRIADFKNPISDEELIKYYIELCSKYPIISIEDGMPEDQWESWTKLTATLGNKIQIVGADLYATNIQRIQQGIKNEASNSVLIQPNQIGTITETVNAVELAHNNGMTCILGHCLGETMDTSIAELAVGLNAGQIKAGAISRGEHLAKYNQILRIEEALENGARFFGKDFMYRAE